MPYKKLSTAKVAKATGVHPNTVRLYEQWGFLPAVPRSASGYRLFTTAHVDQMRLARLVMGGSWAGRAVRHSGVQVVRQAAASDLSGALEEAYHHLTLVRSERAQAETAVGYVERWAEGIPGDLTVKPVLIKEAAKILHSTPDALRNWERNGLIQIPRHPSNGYRLYGQIEINRLRVIRMLLRAGYSIMAVLRMLLQLDQGRCVDLRQALDTPRPDEDVFSAADRWLSALTEHEQTALQMIDLLEDMINKRNS